MSTQQHTLAQQQISFFSPFFLNAISAVQVDDQLPCCFTCCPKGCQTIAAATSQTASNCVWENTALQLLPAHSKLHCRGVYFQRTE
jgi:hypothetical protein